ncbi:MAG: chemotaxis protein CheB, partial [Gemmatimonadales bacterium]
MARARRAGQEAPRKQAAPPAAEANPAGAPPPPFAVVGIGASAGGLAAISHLLDALPPDTGMAFVVITHLSATHESKLAEILSRHTAMAVTEVHDEPEILPNTVFVIPPARSMIVADGHLKLLPRPPGAEARRPIDQFLESLAETWSYSSIGIILSGTSNDGTYGLQAVKAHGGITFAQDASAEHSGMPESAVASGIVDFILSPEAIAAELVRIGRHPHVAHPQVPAGGEEQRRMDRIVALLREVLGADFSNYKKNTLYRRITRRMLLRHMQGLEAYLQLLQQDPAELNALYHDILISVTSFFRNPEAFEALKETVFPRLIAERSNTEPVRIWSVGCSTGEEPYSLAIAWTEFAETIDNAPGVQIFASDLNQRAVSFARGGNYSRRIAQEMSAERLKRFFTETPDGYHVNRDIRERVVFAQHDALNDPPFSRVDMVSCRNVLIYLEASLQQ